MFSAQGDVLSDWRERAKTSRPLILPVAVELLDLGPVLWLEIWMYDGTHAVLDAVCNFVTRICPVGVVTI